jgi:hypothetical protein
MDSITNISIPAQRNRLLEALINGTVTTYEAREMLNIVQPAARIIELREQGHDIVTSLETLPDAAGRLHPRSARYILIALAQEVMQ